MPEVDESYRGTLGGLFVAPSEGGWGSPIGWGIVMHYWRPMGDQGTWRSYCGRETRSHPVADQLTNLSMDSTNCRMCNAYLLLDMWGHAVDPIKAALEHWADSMRGTWQAFAKLAEQIKDGEDGN